MCPRRPWPGVACLLGRSRLVITQQCPLLLVPYSLVQGLRRSVASSRTLTGRTIVLGRCRPISAQGLDNLTGDVIIGPSPPSGPEDPVTRFQSSGTRFIPSHLLPPVFGGQLGVQLVAVRIPPSQAAISLTSAAQAFPSFETGYSNQRPLGASSRPATRPHRGLLTRLTSWERLRRVSHANIGCSGYPNEPQTLSGEPLHSYRAQRQPRPVSVSTLETRRWSRPDGGF